MQDEASASKRDLIARVATLELLVADLIHELWKVDPQGMERLAADATHDWEIHHNRAALPAGEHQRQRLHTVLETRRRMLKKKATAAA